MSYNVTSKTAIKKSAPEDKPLGNIFILRFKILYEHYLDAMYNKHNGDTFRIIRENLEITDYFTLANLKWLQQYGYIDYDPEYIQTTNRDYYFVITHRGIRFVEFITNGDMSFDDEKIEEHKLVIIHKFKENNI